MNRFRWCAILLLTAASNPVLAEEEPAPAPLQKGDALLVRIENLGGGLPEYREIVDSDGHIEVPFLGFLPVDGKLPDAVAAEMAEAYAKAKLASNAVIRITFVTHFEPPPARATLVRSQDPRRPVPVTPAAVP